MVKCDYSIIKIAVTQLGKEQPYIILTELALFLNVGDIEKNPQPVDAGILSVDVLPSLLSGSDKRNP